MTKDECIDILLYADDTHKIMELIKGCEVYLLNEPQAFTYFEYYVKDDEITWDYHWLKTKLGLIRVYDEHTDIIKYLTNTKKIGFAVFGEWKPFYRHYFDTYKIRKLDKNG